MARRADPSNSTIHALLRSNADTPGSQHLLDCITARVLETRGEVEPTDAHHLRYTIDAVIRCDDGIETQLHVTATLYVPEGHQEEP